MSKASTAIKTVLQFVAYLTTSLALNLVLTSFTPVTRWGATVLGAAISAILWLTVAPIVAPTWFPFPKHGFGKRKGSTP